MAATPNLKVQRPETVSPTTNIFINTALPGTGRSDGRKSLDLQNLLANLGNVGNVEGNVAAATGRRVSVRLKNGGEENTAIVSFNTSSFEVRTIYNWRLTAPEEFTHLCVKKLGIGRAKTIKLYLATLDGKLLGKLDDINDIRDDDVIVVDIGMPSPVKQRPGFQTTQSSPGFVPVKGQLFPGTPSAPEVLLAQRLTPTLQDFELPETQLPETQSPETQLPQASFPKRSVRVREAQPPSQEAIAKNLLTPPKMSQPKLPSRSSQASLGSPVKSPVNVVGRPTEPFMGEDFQLDPRALQELEKNSDLCLLLVRTGDVIVQALAYKKCRIREILPHVNAALDLTGGKAATQMYCYATGQAIDMFEDSSNTVKGLLDRQRIGMLYI
jgi:hypothetical protein